METINFDKTAILALDDQILPKSKSPKALETKDFEKIIKELRDEFDTLRESQNEEWMQRFTKLK